ncbi:MAG: hypothetical protein ACI84K_001644 [Pseudohongiellaceae bacterium]|jgi:hypothetical protein
MTIKTHIHCNISNIKSKVYLFIIATIIQFNHLNAAEVFNSETIHVENHSPVIQLFSLSRPDYTPNKQTNTKHLKTRVELTNYLSQTNKGNEYFFIDGETLTVTNTYQHQISSNFILHLTIPWLRHNKGIADNFIYRFHELFQLPQNGRTNEREDQLSWVLSKGENQAISINDHKSGIGDIKVKLSWSHKSFGNTQITSQLKLPTGSFNNQTGSEKIDFGMSILQNNPDWLKNRNWLSDFPLSVWYGAGINYVSAISELEDFDAYPVVATLRTGLAWSIFPSWNIKAQLDSNTPVFDSDIRELGWMPAQISLATEHRLSNNVTLDFVLIEDLRPRASPDVMFSSGLSIQF